MSWLKFYPCAWRIIVRVTKSTLLNKTLAELVEFKTVSGNHSETRRLYDYVRQRCANLPVTFEETSSNGFTSLAVYTGSTTHPKLTLQVHVDVVTADDDQFKLQRKNGKLFGRGTYDMKFALACYLEIFDNLGEDLANYDVALLLTDDEEIGSANGAKLLIEQGYKTDVVVIPDGGDYWHIEKSAKGTWEINLTFHGEATHGSRPWTGDNASEKLVKMLAEMYEQLPNDEDGITANVTQLEAVTSHNQIPGEARAAVDIRFKTTEQYDYLRKTVESLADKYDATIDLFLGINPININLHNPYIQRFMKSVESVRGKQEDPTMSYGASDGRFFDLVGIPVIVMRPEGGDAHGGSEWIDEKGFEEYYRVLLDYVKNVAPATQKQYSSVKEGELVQ